MCHFTCFRLVVSCQVWLLCDSLINFQDKGLRELAAKALSALVNYDPEYYANIVLDKIIPSTLSADLYMRHGATLAAGEVVLALHKRNYSLSSG